VRPKSRGAQKNHGNNVKEITQRPNAFSLQLFVVDCRLSGDAEELAVARATDGNECLQDEDSATPQDAGKYRHLSDVTRLCGGEPCLKIRDGRDGFGKSESSCGFCVSHFCC